MGDNSLMTVFDLALLLAAVIILFAALSVRIGSRLGLPTLLLFLLIGMVLGPAGFGVQFNDPELARGLGLAALALILAEGGLSARWHEIRPALAPAGLLATVGSAASIGVMAVFCHCAFSIDWTVAALLGAVTAPTDSAAVFSILRGVSLPSRLKSILEAESGLNDAPTVLVVVALSAMATGDPLPGGVWGLIVSIAVQLAAGVLMGLLVGWLGAHVTRRVKLPSSSLYGVVAMCWASLAYGLAVLAHVSGFAAVYVAAVVIGNSDLPYQHATELFAEGVGWICQIGLFVMLGLLANPDRLTWVPVLQGVIIGLFLTLVARPLAVFVSTVSVAAPGVPVVGRSSWGGADHPGDDSHLGRPRRCRPHLRRSAGARRRVRPCPGADPADGGGTARTGRRLGRQGHRHRGGAAGRSRRRTHPGQRADRVAAVWNHGW